MMGHTNLSGPTDNLHRRMLHKKGTARSTKPERLHHYPANSMARNTAGLQKKGYSNHRWKRPHPALPYQLRHPRCRNHAKVPLPFLKKKTTEARTTHRQHEQQPLSTLESPHDILPNPYLGKRTSWDFRPPTAQVCYTHCRGMGETAFCAFPRPPFRISVQSDCQRNQPKYRRSHTALRHRHLFAQRRKTLDNRRIQSPFHHHYTRGFRTDPELQFCASRRVSDCKQRHATLLLPHGLPKHDGIFFAWNSSLERCPPHLQSVTIAPKIAERNIVAQARHSTRLWHRSTEKVSHSVIFRYNAASLPMTHNH